MKKASCFIVPLFFILTSCYSQSMNYTSNEKMSIQVFHDFTKYLDNAIKSKADIGDSAHLNFILSHYIFTNTKADSLTSGGTVLNYLPNDKLVNLTAELNSFYRYLQGRENEDLAENLTAIPIRLSDDKYIYNNLTSFQKENTFVFYDKRSSKKILGYILFMPPMKNLITSPKIWSWTLEFKFGKFVFKSVTGEEGYEYMFGPDGHEK